MKTVIKYFQKYNKRIVLTTIIKFIGTNLELLIPYVLEHMIDNVAPTKDLKLILIWGFTMLFLAFAVRQINVAANRMAVHSAAISIYDLRKDLFFKSLTLRGSQLDEIGLPSITARLTADCYNVQNFLRIIQTLGIRAPILFIGGMTVTMIMDSKLALILWIIAPILLTLVVIVSAKGIPLFDNVQNKLDSVVRVMRENITGIRVVKALSKEEYEINRFNKANDDMGKAERKAGYIMALPGPLISLFLNLSLVIVILVGARNVNEGLTEPGVILAFLTYFNMILNSVNGLNRVFTNLSKANASANRIEEVLKLSDILPLVDSKDAAKTSGSEFIIFDDVSFSYSKQEELQDYSSFNNEGRLGALDHINFKIEKGGSLGIIGATGCGKTTIINLLMRFYDATSGNIFIDGKDIRTYNLDDLHRMFGVVFQNDIIFADSIMENISFGRDVSKEDAKEAARTASANSFISEYEDAYEHEALFRGMNFSGGQKQRILISRALASKPKILVLDDSSSALDYKTDASVRNAVESNYKDTTTIIIAQRISSIKNLDQIIMLDEGKILGIGTHDYLLKTCPKYASIFEVQMGEGV